MYDWPMLYQAVSATLDSDRIGAPVFVRWTASVAQNKNVLKAQLAEMTACANRWLAANVRQLYATGAEAQGHLSLALEYATGGSALLALALAHNRPYMNLAIYGARGAVYHNDFIALSSPEAVTAQRASPTVIAASSNLSTPDAHVILEAIDQSLAANQPISMMRTGGQL